MTSTEEQRRYWRENKARYRATQKPTPSKPRPPEQTEVLRKLWREKAAKWRAAHPEEQRAANRRNNAAMRARRGPLRESRTGTCDICGAPPPATRSLARDHNHTTGQWRGHLCTRCNMGLGYFKDDPELLRSAIAYLKEHE